MRFLRRVAQGSRRARLAPEAPVVPAADLAVGMVLADGSVIEAAEVFEGDYGVPVDRSAGRFCRVCDRYGSHHTDRHAQFMTVRVTTTTGGVSRTWILTGTDPVLLLSAA